MVKIFMCASDNDLFKGSFDVLWQVTTFLVSKINLEKHGNFDKKSWMEILPYELGSLTFINWIATQLSNK